jgi:hypothetical protein
MISSTGADNLWSAFNLFAAVLGWRYFSITRARSFHLNSAIVDPSQ